MDSTPIYTRLAPQSDLLEPPSTSYTITAPSYEIRSDLIDQIRISPFRGESEENPYTHLKDFGALYDTFRIEGVTPEAVRWKLFLFSLEGAAKKWYDRHAKTVGGDWGRLETEFCKKYFPLSKIRAYRAKIINFAQDEGESLGHALERICS